ncbi:MAG: GGDEF domain-containing protein [Myxococcaceae bacterium]|nr:GGDEF domain-containing protein [Myxococcaceae bacterium]
MSLPAELEAELKELFPASQYDDAPVAFGVRALVDAERGRRGGKDPVSGAYHRLGLLSGALLRDEYDLSTHGHHERWVMGVLVVDPIELIRVNMEHGFAAGDEALRSITTALSTRFPLAKVVRFHSDGFAVLCGVTSQVTVDGALAKDVAAFLEGAVRLPSGKLVFTVGALRLEVKDPPNHEVLGALLASECDRALVLSRREVGHALQHRAVNLDGRLHLTNG